MYTYIFLGYSSVSIVQMCLCIFFTLIFSCFPHSGIGGGEAEKRDATLCLFRNSTFICRFRIGNKGANDDRQTFSITCLHRPNVRSHSKEQYIFCNYPFIVLKLKFLIGCRVSSLVELVVNVCIMCKYYTTYYRSVYV